MINDVIEKNKIMNKKSTSVLKLLSGLKLKSIDGNGAWSGCLMKRAIYMKGYVGLHFLGNYAICCFPSDDQIHIRLPIHLYIIKMLYNHLIVNQFELGCSTIMIWGPFH